MLMFMISLSNCVQLNRFLKAFHIYNKVKTRAKGGVLVIRVIF